MPEAGPAGSLQLVTTPRDLVALQGVLSGQPAVAVDTESNSLYAYYEQVCLIQLAIPGADYIVDPRAGLDLAPLGEIFADPAIQKVFHAAEQDVAGLRRDFDFHFANLFDTMWAGRILGWAGVGLATVLAETFGVKLDKRYQRHNWGERPLRPEALAYARLDVCYLLSLRDRQAAALEQSGRSEEASEVFAQLAQTPPSPPHYGPEAFWRVKDVYALGERERAVLWELYLWRDQMAQKRDRPPFKVIGDAAMVEVACAHPHTWTELTPIPGLTPYLVQRYGRDLLAAVLRGERGRPPQMPRSRRPSEAVLGRYEALRAWRQQVAAQRGVDPDVIVSNTALWTLAQRNPAAPEELEGIEHLGPWKRRTYGPVLLRVLRARS